MIPNPAPSPSLSVQTYLQVLRRQRRVIILVTLLTAAFATLPALLDDPVYTSSSRIQVSSLADEGVFSGDEATLLPTDRARELLTEIELILSSPMRSRVMEQFAEPPTFEDPTVAQVGFSEIVEITITASDPDTAADVANAYAEVFVEDRHERSVEALLAKSDELRDQSAIASTELDRINQQLADPALAPERVATLQLQQGNLAAQVQDYNRRADELDVEAELRGRGTQVVSPAQLELDPITASVPSAAVLGLTLGFLLGLTIAIVTDTVQDRVGNRDDLAGVRPDTPVLASVPHADLGTAPGGGGFAVQEAYRYLRTGVRVFRLNSTLRSVLITSATPNEGKTTTAANLAVAMAEAGDRVVLVDCDLRRPALHTWFDLPNERGLTSLVIGDASLAETITFIDDNLAVVTSGPPVENPTEMLGSEEFARVLRAIVAQADFTIVDTPPVLPVADALIAGQHVDGVIGVCRMGRVRRRAVRELFNRLDEAAITAVGLVANDSKDESSYEEYGPGPVRTKARR